MKSRINYRVLECNYTKQKQKSRRGKLCYHQAIEIEEEEVTMRRHWGDDGVWAVLWPCWGNDGAWAALRQRKGDARGTGAGAALVLD